MIRVAALLAAASAVFILDAAASSAEAQQRRRPATEVTVSRPGWLTTPRAELAGSAGSMRPDIRFGVSDTSGYPATMSSSMRLGLPVRDPFMGGPGFRVNWPWPAAFYRD